jgi:hypothetical protein
MDQENNDARVAMMVHQDAGAHGCHAICPGYRNDRMKIDLAQVSGARVALLYECIGISEVNIRTQRFSGRRSPLCPPVK